MNLHLNKTKKTMNKFNFIKVQFKNKFSYFVNSNNKEN